ncbi:hypothetical protein QZH41_002104, partial [Actinostola sp. cb2023]
MMVFAALKQPDKTRTTNSTTKKESRKVVDVPCSRTEEKKRKPTHASEKPVKELDRDLLLRSDGVSALGSGTFGVCYLGAYRGIPVAIKELKDNDGKKTLNHLKKSVIREAKRHHLIERKDLHNIQHAFGLNEVQRHPNDQQSVLAWIQEWKDSTDFENPLLYYKLQGEVAEEGYDLAKEDFFLVIQAPIQKRMFTKFAPNGVCIDSTHRTNAYDFMLTTVMVIDEFGEGFPGAWCLSYHEDFTTMCIFFNEIKKNCGTTHSRFLMTDMAPQYYNAWVGVMGNARPAKFLCTWHVDKAWKEELRKKVGDITIETEIYKMLRTTLEQTSTTLFQDCLRGLIK